MKNKIFKKDLDTYNTSTLIIVFILDEDRSRFTITLKAFSKRDGSTCVSKHQLSLSVKSSANSVSTLIVLNASSMNQVPSKKIIKTV